jgi:hypothetical protein
MPQNQSKQDGVNTDFEVLILILDKGGLTLCAFDSFSKSV